jgi:hypothetical protein
MSQDELVDRIDSRRTHRATFALGWRLLGAMLVFAVVALAVVTLAVLGGTTEISASDAGNVSLISGVAAVAALAFVTSNWWQATSAEQRCWLHYLMIATAASLIVAGTIAFATARAPRNVRRPSLSGVPHVGSSLAARPGVWSLPTANLDFDYQWQPCVRVCDDIDGATGPTYTLRRADVGKRLRLALVATPHAGGWRDFRRIPSTRERRSR